MIFSSWKRWKHVFISSTGASGGLALLWNSYNVDLQLVAFDTNWMLSFVKSKVSSVKFWLFNIYAPLGIQDKCKLWRELGRISSPLRQGSFVVFGGDFNAIVELGETSGGILPNKRIMDDFGAFMSDLSLFNCKTHNGVFTWTNMRRGFSQIAERVDRFLLSENWINSDVDFSSSILPNPGFDHFPISFSILEDKPPHKSLFKFEPMCFRDPSFLPLLKKWWEFAPFVSGSRMFQIIKKLSFLKLNIREWNLVHFKNIF